MKVQEKILQKSVIDCNCIEMLDIEDDFLPDFADCENIANVILKINTFLSSGINAVQYGN